MSEQASKIFESERERLACSCEVGHMKPNMLREREGEVFLLLKIEADFSLSPVVALITPLSVYKASELLTSP